MTSSSDVASTTTRIPQSERIEWYQKQIAHFENEIATESTSWRTLSFVRGCLFLAALGAGIAGFMTAMGVRNPWFILAGCVFLVFLYVAYLHEGLESRLREKKIWRRLYRWSLARLERDWDKLKATEVEIDPKYAAFSNDLDLFGKSSLFQLVGGVETKSGIDLFRKWILGVPTLVEVQNRQKAIQELESLEQFRDQLRFRCHLTSAGDSGPETLVEWATSPAQFDVTGILVNIARVFALASVIGLVGLITGLIPITFAGPFMMAMIALNFLMTVLFAGKIHSVFNQVASRHDQVSHYNEVFALIKNQAFEGTLLTDIQNELFNQDSNVLNATNHLGRIAWRANLRRHGLLFPAYVAFQFLFLWDFHIYRRLKAWKSEHGDHVERWFNLLGHWEVLAAIGKFAEDHGDWCYPEFNATSPTDSKIIGQQVGHPLLKHDQRVNNDVQVGPAGSVLLVTGSNMSGKSTLLRAVGLNTVLAQLGGPVCATSLSLSPMRIETSMRIQDSLADGVSFFMAELKRLKQIVDIAREFESNPETTVLFLLDEILQGTNSQERHIAVTRVIRHLIDHNAIGAVSTHDLELGHSTDLAEACRPVHFRESFSTVDGKKRMTFDYQVRHGIATTTNALKLLELVGLIDDEN